ncbi:MAG: hypothetical protein SOR61_01105 [Evtepia sp.]|uniref:hypothetical protein n=1 Tax=Evtepia sp. TaxID=2773933 RepID=UPI002A757D25|nr:hypothetical protein [Evtepia sp.]MDY3013797.1 hypothetical protein [Evtepia sp.]
MRRTLNRRTIDRLENLLILLLLCTALFLVKKTGMFQDAFHWTTNQTAQTLNGMQDTALYRGTPVRMMVKTQGTRYGVQYDQNAVNALYQEGFSAFLTKSVASMERPREASLDEWKQAVEQADTWVFYDFLYDVSFAGQDNQEEREARLFFVTMNSGWADTVYYYQDKTGHFYKARIKESGLSFPRNIEKQKEGEVHFAFEVPEIAEVVAPFMMIGDLPTACPVYTASNPLEGIDTIGRNRILELLGFHEQAASFYHSADGEVIQEGSDTLRIQKNGSLVFHGSENGDSRYQALSSRSKDLQIKAEEVLQSLRPVWSGLGEMRCQSITVLPEGEMELRFTYTLDGIPVYLGEDGWSARFVFRGTHLISYTIYFRQYSVGEERSPVLPERQVAAAAHAMGQTGKELQLYYRDDGGKGAVQAGWIPRDQG